MMRTLALAFFAIVLAACQTAPSPRPVAAQATPYALSAEDVEAIKRDLPGRLKDPASAVFGDMAAATNEQGVVSVCGMVNARNSFGGYTGFQPFMGILATNVSGNRVFAVNGIGDGGNRSIAIAMLCQRYGIIG